MRALVLLLSLSLASVASAKDASISMMHSNAIDQTSPFELVRSGSWKADPRARYVKLHVYLDEPVSMSAVEVDTCKKPDRPQFSLWVNFDESVFYRENDDVPGPEPGSVGFEGKTFFARGFETGTELRSLTFNFESWQGVALCGLRIFDEAGKPYTLRVPATVAGNASASSTLAPEAAYDVMNLFDSRFEYAWASAGLAKGVDLAFHFAEPQRIDRLRIWNGYQRSGAHCIANSRAKRLSISGDDGYSAVVDVADVLGSQVIALPKPFAGRELRIRVVDAYPGKSYRDLVVSELRFGNAAGWFMLDALPAARAAAAANRARFDAAGLESSRVLNQSYISSSDEAGFRGQDAILRLRADGSFYLSGTGSHDPGRGRSRAAADDAELRAYFTLGNFEVTERAVENGVRLRLFGIYYETDAYGDCNGCGRDCNRKDDPALGRIFEEFVTVKARKGSDGSLLLRVDNESGGRKLPFKSLELRPQQP